MEFTEEELSEFADLIHGRGRWAFWGPGLHTYPDGDENSRAKHAICEELARRGIAVGRQIDNHWFWSPAPQKP